jgi:hypothetical protein
LGLHSKLLAGAAWLSGAGHEGLWPQGSSTQLSKVRSTASCGLWLRHWPIFIANASWKRRVRKHSCRSGKTTARLSWSELFI